MCHRSAGACPSCMVVRGLGCYCMIWSAAKGDAGADSRGYMIDISVYSILN